MVPYYKQLLTTINIYSSKRENLGDSFDYSQGKYNEKNMGTLVAETLEVLERSGGPKAFSSIKLCIPTYQSCLL